MYNISIKKLPITKRNNIMKKIHMICEVIADIAEQLITSSDLSQQLQDRIL